MRKPLRIIHDLALLARTGIVWAGLWVNEHTIQAVKMWRSER